jgi:hypothetical protein
VSPLRSPPRGRYDALPVHTHVKHIANSKFDALRVVALKLDNTARRLDIKFVDASQNEFIVSLPITAAVELGNFIHDATQFMTQLKERRPDSSR